MHWTLGTAASRRARFISIFLALSFSCSQAESMPATRLLEQTVGIRRKGIAYLGERNAQYGKDH